MSSRVSPSAHRGSTGLTPQGGPRGGAPRGGRGGGPSKGGANAPADKKKKENILNLAIYVDQTVKIKFMGGREVTGTLKGYDQLLNLVMDDVVEEFEDERPSRQLGLVVLRGPNIALISPTDGSAEIENPFQQ